MPWQPLPRIAFAVATYPFQASSPADLPLELGDELYIIEEGGKDGQWFRGYLIAPPSLLAGLTSVKGQTLEARVFSGIFPRSCVEVRELLGEVAEDEETDDEGESAPTGPLLTNGTVASDGSVDSLNKLAKKLDNTLRAKAPNPKPHNTSHRQDLQGLSLAIPTERNPDAPKPPAPVPMLKVGDETPTSTSEPLVDEIASCLREWHSTNLHELLLSRKYPLLEKMANLVRSLNLSRRQFLHNVLTTHELEQLREKVVWDLVKGNKLFNGEIIVRDPNARGRILTGDDSVIEITKLQSIMSVLDEKPRLPIENLSLHHLLLDIKAFVGAAPESTTLTIYLASKPTRSSANPLSESYIMDISPGSGFTTLGESVNMRTLFTDLGPSDVGDTPSADTQLYLVVKVGQVEKAVPGRTSTSRHATAPREEHLPNGSGQSHKTADGTKSTRRSLMWGKSSGRSHYSRNAPISKMAAVNEQESHSHSSQEAPPSTASSRGTSDRPKTAASSHQVTRTLGVGVLKLNAIMKQDSEIEQVITVWSPSQRFDLIEQDTSDGFNEVIRDLMDSKTGNYERSRKTERLQVRLKPFVSDDAEALIKSTPTLLSDITRTSRIGFAGAPTKPRSDIYFTFDDVALPRHALLSRSTGSAAPVSPNLVGLNLQLTLEVRRPTGERIENCIYPSSNGPAISSWESTAVERGEPWKQTIRLAVPQNDVPICHLAMIISDAPNAPFAICHVPLWDQNAFLKDGSHSLLLYKYDSTTSVPGPNANGIGGYLNLPWSARSKDNTSKDEAVTGPLATLRIHSYLCSTRISQDKILLGLLRWKEQPAGEIPEILKRLTFVPEIEIVKLLNNVFDALFSILVEYSGNDEYEDLAFAALVMVLGIVHDRRFNLGPLVDQYAETQFRYPFATPCLVRSFTRLLDNPSAPETARELRATFKVVRHILKFITHARDQQRAKEADIGIVSTSSAFSRHMRTIFKALDGLMRNPAPILVGSQTLAVQHFHTWLPELKEILSTEEILHIAIDFMDSCAQVKGKLILYKLVLIINYSRLDLFSQPDQQSALAANTVRWLAPHWGKTAEVTEQYREQVRLCCSVLATQVNMLGSEVPDHIPKIIDSYRAIQAAPVENKGRLSLLFPASYPFPSKPVAGKTMFNEALIELSAILSAISTSQQGMQLEMADDELATLLEDTLHVHLSILHCEAFPPSWLSVHIYHHKSTIAALEYIAGILLDSFLPEPDDAGLNYNTELWKIFFTTLLTLVGSRALALEAFPEQKRRAVWKIAGDVREHGAELLHKTWEAIGWDTSLGEKQRYGLSKMGGYQVQYVPALVGPIVELCLSVHEGLRHVAVEVLQTMIASEWNMSEDLSVIQTEMIECLDHLFKSKPPTETVLQKLFIAELMNLFDPLSHIPDDPLYAALNDLISTVDEFMDLLVAVHGTDGTGEASNLIHRLRLMDFLRDMQKEEIFVRYVHQLATLQSESRNFTEAGLALRLHAELYNWDPTKFLPALSDPEYPAQSAFDRKESLYFEMIKHFEDGEAWSSALAAYKELEVQYAQNVFDFSKLARTQRSMATVYESIAKSEKIVHKYFRVTYRGLGFPSGLRDKEFVYEGLPQDKTSTFTDRIQEQHPAAQIVPSGDIEEVEGQFLQISLLSPHRDFDHRVFQRARVPQVVRDYMLSTDCHTFSNTLRRNTTGPVAEHWADKLVYVTADDFPTILRRSEILSVDRIRLNPLQTALERIIRKTQEMSAVEKKVVDGDEEVISLLIEAINISVNPNSDSSVVQYRELLPAVTTDEDGEEHEPELSPLENAVKVSLVDHAIMIKRCLAMFAKSTNTQLRSSHDGLSQNFESTFAPEIASFTIPQPRESEPIPAWSISSPGIDSLGRQSLPRSQTNGTGMSADAATIDSRAESRPTRQERNRLSFLSGRSKQDRPPVSFKMNGNANGSLRADDASSTRSRSKENRRSFFGGTSHPSVSGDGGDGDWVTDSGVLNDSLRRSTSSQRPDTAASIGSAVGSVRKRFSMLKLGKKTSKASVLVDSVAEE